MHLHIPAKVTVGTLYVVQPDKEHHTELVKCAVDLQEYLAAGALHPCNFENREELALFVQMAAQLGDGEAACFAIAAKRGWALATDDRRARRLAAESSLAVITTPELVKLWAENTQASDEEIAAVLQNIERFAYFTPRASAPKYGWWISCLGKARK
jgi:predicted nucleic acid-binding protein